MHHFTISCLDNVKGHSLVNAFPFSLSLADLRKFRSYKGGSVRDLLRAMRNKVGKSSQVLTLKEMSICCYIDLLWDLPSTETPLPRVAC